MKSFISLVVLSTVSTISFAADLGPTKQNPAPIKVDKAYNLQADVGYIFNDSKSSDGSKSSKQNLTASALWQRMSADWGQELRAEALNTNDDSSSNNIERYLVAGKVSHHESNAFYEFAKLQWEKDLSSSFDYQTSLTAGVGYEFLRDDVQSLSAELGAGYRMSKERAAPKDTYNEAIGSAALFYERAITPTIKFNQDIGYEFGKESNVLRAKTAFSAAINSRIAAQATYQLKNVSADQGDSRDSLVSLGLRYTH